MMYSFPYRFTKHVEGHNPKDILTLDEFLRLRQDVIVRLEEERKSKVEASGMTLSPLFPHTPNKNSDAIGFSRFTKCIYYNEM